jgi:hypothetical protein
VYGFQREVPPGIDATLDLQVKITSKVCESMTCNLVFEFYRDKFCQGSPIKSFVVKDVTTTCGDNCYIFAWGPVPDVPVCDWYSVKVIYSDLYEDCYVFHIADPSPMGRVAIHEELDF